MAFDDPIGRHVAGLPPELASLRIEQLLSHTAGLSLFLRADLVAAINDASTATALVPLVIAERRSEAGAFRYSNAGYVLLGAAIEAASGLSYDEYISLLEQPAYKRVREYISVIGRTVYLTFPFTRDEDFPKVWEEYLVIRRRQLDELYFRN